MGGLHTLMVGTEYACQGPAIMMTVRIFAYLCNFVLLMDSEDFISIIETNYMCLSCRGYPHDL